MTPKRNPRPRGQALRAMTSGDLASLEELLHDQLLYNASSGMMDTKAELAAGDEVPARPLQIVKCSDQQVRIFGEVRW